VFLFLAQVADKEEEEEDVRVKPQSVEANGQTKRAL